MAFCKFSSEYIAKSFTLIDNVFFARYLPSTPPKLTTIYLYGLYLCSTEGQDTGGMPLDVDNFAKTLGFEIDDIIDAYNYWEEQGLVRIVSRAPFMVQYQPIKGASSANKRFSKDKYTEFNAAVQKILDGRMITPTEFEEYYSLMEGFSLPDGRKLEPEALIKIIRYCTEQKGANIGYRYIITVAQNWAREGYVTAAQISEKLDIYSMQSQEVTKVNKALGSTRKPGVDEFELFSKWTENLGFSVETICFVAKALKKAGFGANFEKLDKKLQKYYEAHLLSESEIKEYEKNKDNLFNLAREINRTLGLYYNDVSNEVDTYIQPWLARGFSAETILLIAQDCYTKSKRTLGAMADKIEFFSEKGIVSHAAYLGYLDKSQAVKADIAKVLTKLGIERKVTSLDIEFWQRWRNAWGMDAEMIDLAVDFAAKKGSTLSYVNTIIADWHSQGIRTTVAAAEALKKFEQTIKTSTKPDSKIKKREYTDSEQASIFDNFNEIEL